jgi:hypothetical protein
VINNKNRQEVRKQDKIIVGHQNTVPDLKEWFICGKSLFMPNEHVFMVEEQSYMAMGVDICRGARLYDAMVLVATMFCLQHNLFNPYKYIQYS